MIKHIFVTAFALIIILNHTFSQPQIKSNISEKFEMQVAHTPNLLPFNKIRSQKALTMDQTGSARGIISSYLVSKGIQGIQSLIDSRKKRFTTSYSFAIKDEKFYQQISTLGQFDPTGIRFKGFEVARILKTGEDVRDTAFIAKFSLDTTGDKINEIMNNGIFRLKLDTFILKNARVKLPHNGRKLNMDLEISFISSFIMENGLINTDALVGKFIYQIRNAPLNNEDPSYLEFYQNLPKKNPYCIGQSFLIPRSVGYYKKEGSADIEKCFGEGLYSIKVAVKESSKNTFIDKVIIYTSDDIMSVGNAALQKKYGKAPAKVKVKTK